MDNVTLHIQEWLPLVGFFIPLVVGVLTKSKAPDAVKTFVMLFITAVAALVNQVSGDGGVLTTEALYTWLGTTMVTITSYYGIWKPLNVKDLTNPEVGIGGGQ